MTMTQAYPCDRGIPNNVLGRGWHNFQANSAGIICCTFCGATPEGVSS